MIRMKHAVAAALATTALSAPALAQDGEFHAGIGYNHISLENIEVGTIVLRGGYDFTENFGVEAEGQIGVVDDSIGSTDVGLDYALGLFAKAQVPVNEQFSLFGRVGVVNAEADAGAFGSDNETGWGAGVGGEWEFSPNNAVRVEYTRYEFDDGDADAFGINYVRRFAY